MSILDTFYILYKNNASEEIAATKKVDAAHAELEKHLTKNESEKLKARKALIAAEKELATLQKNQKKQTEDIAKNYENIVGSLTGIVAAYFTASSAFGAMGKAQSFTANLEMQSKWLGINGKELANWQGIVKSVGGTAEDFDSAIKNLHDSYIRMGFNVNGGALLENLKKLSDIMHAHPEQAEAIGLNFGLNEPMILALMKGRGELDKILETQNRINSVSEDGLRISREFDAAWKDAKTNVNGFWIELNNKVLPTLTRVLDSFNKGGLGGFIDDNNERGRVRKLLGWNTATPEEVDAYIAKQRAAGAGPAAGGGALGLRTNNPGNLQPGGQQAQYPTPEAGLAAMADNLRRYGRKGWNTIDQIASHWAPADGKGNSEATEEAYKKALEKALGVGRFKALDLNNPDTLSALMGAITKQENSSNPFSDTQMRKAIMAGKGTMDMSSNAPLNSSYFSSSVGGAKSLSVQTGPVTIHTQATDAQGIAADFHNSIKDTYRIAASNADDGMLA